MQPTTLRTAQRSHPLSEWAGEKRSELTRWLTAPSRIFTALCGEPFTHGEVLLAHLFLIVLFAACGVAEWLEGGAL